jgi:hypothetical protein
MQKLFCLPSNVGPFFPYHHIVVLFAGMLVVFTLPGEKHIVLVATCKRWLCGNATLGSTVEVLSAVVPVILGLVPHTVYFHVQHYTAVFIMYI